MCVTIVPVEMDKMRTDEHWGAFAREMKNLKSDIQNIYLIYLNISVGLKPKIPIEPEHFYFGTENFEHFRFQSI